LCASGGKPGGNGKGQDMDDKQEGGRVHRWRFLVELDGEKIECFTRPIELSEPAASKLEADPAVVVRRSLDTVKFDVCDETNADFWSWVREVVPSESDPWQVEVTLTDGRKLRFPNPRLLWFREYTELRAGPIDLTGHPDPLPIADVRLIPPWDDDAGEADK